MQGDYEGISRLSHKFEADQSLPPCITIANEALFLQLRLEQEVFQVDTHYTNLKDLANETINSFYREEKRLRAFTDDSRSIYSTNVGTGVFCELFYLYVARK
ncbi:hypothetical protein TNCV_3647441 [Trichonephila clavipes]|nr:hypothetical protein TNCV_3647441 [Trichonephila clavipes]